jgi:ribosomal protein L18
MTDISNARTTEPGQLRESRVVHINRVAAAADAAREAGLEF